MKHKKRSLIRCAGTLVFAALVILFPGRAAAAGSIYVNNGQNTLDMNINSAYVIGAGGELSTAGGDYAITGDGIVKIGQSSAGGDSSQPAPISGTVSIKQSTVKIGLFYKTGGSDTALSSANLENKVGSGYQFGYYDSNRVFQPLASTNNTQITMTPSGTGRGVVVTATGTGTVLYANDSNAAYNLAVVPVSPLGKAVTWFKQKTYYGGFEYIRYNGSDKLTVVNIVDVEDYVKGVIPYEMGAAWPLETLKAGAIAARCYVQYNYGKYSAYGFDIVNTASDQVYSGTNYANATTDAACDATRNMYLAYNGKLVSAYYYAANGGATENSENVWLNRLDYCRAKIDPYEQAIDFYCKNWSKSFTAAEISDKLSYLGLGTVARIVPTYTEAGNIYKVEVFDTSGRSYVYSKAACLTFLTKLGFPYTSMHFAVDYNMVSDTYTITGSGAGHNVGLSQWGAYSMAKVYGKNFQEVLGFYYTGVTISQGV